MIDFTLITEAPLWRELGLVLLHFLWQGTLIAALAALFFRALRQRSAAERYAVGCLALAGMLVLPACTWWWVGRASASTIPASAGGMTNGTGSEWVDPFASTGGFEWLALLGLVWFVGTLVQQVRLVLSYLRASQLRQRESTLAPESWQDTMRELSERLGLKRGVQLYQSSLAHVPLIVGWLEPIVLVPIGTLASMSPLELRAILAHELAHLRRLDHLVNALQVVLESLLFFHPAVWWLSARVREEREYCCDDLAVEVCGDPICYARALTSLEELRLAESALILSSNGGSLMHRIQRLVKRDRAKTGGRAYLVAPALFGALVLGLTSGSAYGVAPTTHDCDHHGHCQHHARRAQVKSCEHGKGSQVCGKHSVDALVVVGEKGKGTPLRVGTEVVELQVGEQPLGVWRTSVVKHGEKNPLGALTVVGEKPGDLRVDDQGRLGVVRLRRPSIGRESGRHQIHLESTVKPSEGHSSLGLSTHGIAHVESLGELGATRPGRHLIVTKEGLHELDLTTTVKPHEVHSVKGYTVLREEPGEMHVIEGRVPVGISSSRATLMVTGDGIYEVHSGTTDESEEIDFTIPEDTENPKGLPGVLLRATAKPAKVHSRHGLAIVGEKPGTVHVESQSPQGLTVTEEGHHGLILGITATPDEVHSGHGLTIIGEKPGAIHVEGHSPQDLTVTGEGHRGVLLETTVNPSEVHSGEELLTGKHADREVQIIRQRLGKLRPNVTRNEAGTIVIERRSDPVKVHEHGVLQVPEKKGVCTCECHKRPN